MNQSQEIIESLNEEALTLEQAQLVAKAKEVAATGVALAKFGTDGLIRSEDHRKELMDLAKSAKDNSKANRGTIGKLVTFFRHVKVGK